MTKTTPTVTDVNALRHIVESLGGSVVAGPTFRFDLPLSEIREVIPKLNETTGLGVRRLSERIEEDPIRLGKNQSIITCELYRK